MKKIVRISIFVLIGALFIGTLVFLYFKSKPKKVVFETQAVTINNIVKKTVATGSIVPRREVEIKPQVSGIIAEIYVVAGQKIKKGDIIAKINIVPDVVNLNDAETRLQRAKTAMSEEQISFDRQNKLYKDKVISEVDFRQANLSYQNAKTELEAAENNLQLIKEGITKKSGSVTNTIIRSTIDGMVLDVPVKVGNSVIQANAFNVGTTIAFVADMGEMIFDGKVDETEVGKLHTGMPITLTIGAIDNTTFNATLEYVSPKGALENGAIQFQIKAKVALKDSFFVRSGYSANADIVLDRRDSVPTLPESVIQFSNDSAFVEIETQPQVFEKRYIKTGISDGLNIEIISGIDKTNKVKKP
jgi:HlyD family secretion protein